jgi:hypothetical protein
VENLAGIDLESWNKAFERAKEADRAKWVAEGSNPVSENKYQKWEKPLIANESTVVEINGNYTLTLVIPENLSGKVYDMELFFGLQKPRWEKGEVTQLPEGFTKEDVPGGIKIKSTRPFSVMPLTFKLKGAKNAEEVRIHLTDKEHRNLGYLVPQLIIPVYTRSPQIRDCAQWVGENIGMEDCLEGIMPEVSRGEYPDFMSFRLSGFLTNPDPTIPTAKRNCAQTLLEFLELASDSDRKWAADIFMDSYFAAQKACRGEVVETQTLRVSFSASAHSIRDELGCRSTVTINYDGQDLTGGSYPVIHVVLKVNGVVWQDSGTISTTYYQTSTSREVGCGQVFYIEVTATNTLGQTATSTGSITTPTP